MKHADRDIERFNRWAPTYDRHRLHQLFFEPMQKTVLELAACQVPMPAAILDIGSGTGRLLQAAEKQYPGAALVGVDAAVEMVKQAQSSLPAGSRIEFRVGTAEQLPFPDAQFDLVFSTMTFHHWADQAKGITEVRRVLRPGGRWLLADFIATGPMRFFFLLTRPKRFHERSQIEALVAPAGMRVLAQARVPRLWGQISALAIATDI
jgi:ubiquinone/menaquinone biosynthesis C-methylase UbiE